MFRSSKKRRGKDYLYKGGKAVELNMNDSFELNNGHKIVIRKPKETDASAMIDYIKLVNGETLYLGWNIGEFQKSIQDEAEILRKYYDVAKRRSFTALSGDKIVGNADVSVFNHRERFQHRAIMGISVCKGYWSLGLGSNLMRLCINWCKENKFEQLELDVVSSNNRAISFYKKFGFRKTGTFENAFKYSDGSYANEDHMILFL